MSAVSLDICESGELALSQRCPIQQPLLSNVESRVAHRCEHLRRTLDRIRLDSLAMDVIDKCVPRSLSLCRRSVSDRSDGFTLAELSFLPLLVVFQSSIFNLPLQPLISCDCVVVCASGSLDRDCSIHPLYSVDSDLFVDLCLPCEMHRPNEETSFPYQANLCETNSFVGQETSESTCLDAK